MPPIATPAPEIIPLSAGVPTPLTGAWPDRQAETVSRAELHGFPLTAPRARALVCPGGGYTRLMYDKEGVEIALWLAGLGIEAHVLVHRLPGAPDGDRLHPADIALQDGLRALDHLAQGPRLPLFHVGLSSGGHLAGMLACQDHPLRPAGLLIAYAPLSGNHRDHKVPAGKPDFAPAEKQAFYDAWPIGLEAHPEGVPDLPVFLAYALQDRTVPLDNALRFAATAAARGLDLDLHVFGQAPHGFALRDRDGGHADWPMLAQRWFDRRLAG